MMMHQHPLLLCFSLHPLSSTSEAEMGWLLREPLWLLSPSLFLCGYLWCCWIPQLQPEQFSVQSWAVAVRCVALVVVSAPGFVESDKTSRPWGLQKCESLLMCDSEQHGDPYLAFSYELAVVIHVKKIHLCQAIDYFHSAVKSRDYFISFLRALCLWHVLNAYLLKIAF